MNNAFINAVEGKGIGSVCEFGMKYHTDLAKDRIIRLCYAGISKETLEKDFPEFMNNPGAVVLEAIAGNPKGLGFQVQGSKVMSETHLFAKDIISVELRKVNDLIDDLPKDSEADEKILKGYAGKITDMKDLLKSHDGDESKNALMRMYSYGWVRGDKDGNVKISVSRTKITEENHGDMIVNTDNENSCVEKFDHVGQLIGMAAGIGQANERTFLYFRVIKKNLYLVVAKVNKGITKEVHHGTLIAK